MFDKKIDKVVTVTPNEHPIYNDLYKSGQVDEFFHTSTPYTYICTYISYNTNENHHFLQS